MSGNMTMDRLYRYVPMIAAFASLIGLAACSVGPDYKGPPHIAPKAEKAKAFHRALSSQVSNQTPVSFWWTQLNDPLLTELIQTALQNNPDVKSGAARLRTARAVINEHFASMFPGGGAGAMWMRTQIPLGDVTSVLGGSSEAPQSVALPTKVVSESYAAGFDASWEIDPFGGNRRGLESAKAQSEAQLAQIADTEVQVAAEVARNYISLRGVQNRLALTQTSVDIEQRMLRLTQQRRKEGTASDEDVERFQVQFLQTQASLSPLRTEEAHDLDAIAVLVGMEPGELDPRLSVVKPVLMPPAQVQVGDPASMIRRRPDIRVAERNIVAMNAEIGQVIGQYFPKISLFGTVGFTSANGRRFISGDNFSYMGGPTLEWSILNSARINARVGQAKGERDAAIAHYQNVVLAALQDAETSLARFSHQRDYVMKIQGAKASADRSWLLAQQRHAAGTLSVIDALDVERQRNLLEQEEAQAITDMTVDYVALQKSLGLGWELSATP